MTMTLITNSHLNKKIKKEALNRKKKKRNDQSGQAGQDV